MLPSRVRVAIQHHPARAELVGRLTDGLGGLEHELVVDPGGAKADPWRCYRACLERAGEPGDHLVILQDDAIVCFDFACWIECAISLEPDAAIVLWLGAQPRLSAMAATRALGAGEQFAPLNPRDWLPVVGVLWPAELAADVLEWAETRKKHTRSDDAMLGYWHRERKRRVLVHVPSLVEHPDDVESLLGNGRGSAGRNPARVALHFPP